MRHICVPGAWGVKPKYSVTRQPLSHKDDQYPVLSSDRSLVTSRTMCASIFANFLMFHQLDPGELALPHGEVSTGQYTMNTTVIFDGGCRDSSTFTCSSVSNFVSLYALMAFNPDEINSFLLHDLAVSSTYFACKFFRSSRRRAFLDAVDRRQRLHVVRCRGIGRHGLTHRAGTLRTPRPGSGAASSAFPHPACGHGSCCSPRCGVPVRCHRDCDGR